MLLAIGRWSRGKTGVDDEYKRRTDTHRARKPSGRNESKEANVNAVAGLDVHKSSPRGPQCW